MWAWGGYLELSVKCHENHQSYISPVTGRTPYRTYQQLDLTLHG